ISFKNIEFTYNPTGLTYANNDKVNFGNGCLISSEPLNNLNIENCVFNNTSEDTQRPPFISLSLDNNESLNNINLINNKFNDETTVDNTAICIVSSSSSRTNG